MILGEELHLPRIAPRGKKTITAVRDKYTGVSKVGLRSLSAHDIVGFIDNVPDEAREDFERGVLSASAVENASTR